MADKMAESNSVETVPDGGKGIDLFAVTCCNVSYERPRQYMSLEDRGYACSWIWSTPGQD
jgi:hypothetical protein